MVCEKRHKQALDRLKAHNTKQLQAMDQRRRRWTSTKLKGDIAKAENRIMDEVGTRILDIDEKLNSHLECMEKKLKALEKSVVTMEKRLPAVAAVAAAAKKVVKKRKGDKKKSPPPKKSKLKNNKKLK